MPRTTRRTGRLSTRVDERVLSTGREYALRWQLPLGMIVESALHEFFDRRRDTDLGPLPLPQRARRGPPSRAEALADAATLLRLASRGGRPLGSD